MLPVSDSKAHGFSYREELETGGSSISSFVTFWYEQSQVCGATSIFYPTAKLHIMQTAYVLNRKRQAAGDTMVPTFLLDVA